MKGYNMNELELLNSVKELLELQKETNDKFIDKIKELESRITRLEDTFIDLANAVNIIKTEHEQFVIGFNDLKSKCDSL